MKNSELCVPLKALALSGEGEEAIAPEVGDNVSVNIGGRVTRVEGENAYLMPDSANGEALSDGGAVPSEPSMEEEEEYLRGESRKGMGGLVPLIAFLLLLFSACVTRAEPRVLQLVATFNRPSDTNAYAANDVVSSNSALAFPAAASMPGGSGYITRAIVFCSQTNVTARLRVHLFNQSVACPDNSPFTNTFATVTNYLGYIDLDALAPVSGSPLAQSVSDQVVIPFVCNPTNNTLFAVLQTLDAFTPADVIVTGTADGELTKSVVDSTKDFIALGVAPGALLTDTDTSESATVTLVTQTTLKTGGFDVPEGDNYSVTSSARFTVKLLIDQN